MAREEILSSTLSLKMVQAWFFKVSTYQYLVCSYHWNCVSDPSLGWIDGFVWLTLVGLQNWQLTSPFSNHPVLVSQYRFQCPSSESSRREKSKKFPDCARVIQIKWRTADICLPLNSCSEHTCVTACRLVVFMHVWRSTARTLRSFSAHFFGGVGGMRNTFSLPLPAMKCQPSQNPKQQTYPITDLSHGSTSSVIWFGKFWLSPPILDCGYAKYLSQCCAHNMWQETSQTDVHVLTSLHNNADELWLNALASDTPNYPQWLC